MTEFEIDFDHFDLDHFDHKFLIFNNVAKNFVVTKTFPIFAEDKSTNVDMTRTGTINNALNMRGLKTAI